MRKIIGLIPLYDAKRNSFWMLPEYMRMLEAEGAIPLMLPLTDDPSELDYFLDECGGFLMTGGQDVSPEIYNEERSELCGRPCELRDRMESYVFGKCVEKDKPVLGICRGLQFMNAYLGGTLYQDIVTEHPSETEHNMTAPYARAVHEVTINRSTMLFNVLEKEKLGVNSYHHQAIKKLAPGLEAMAVSEDGLIEAAMMPGKKFLLGVQWHPEFSYESDEDSRKIVRAFIAAV